eukprot:CAMPEP_0184716276 /NCGR_PEP_ID=MMETSP0314-20130426/6044_1 /TAXON_ID=38298 /ORGANISM="Rhodella maculata, Strain CCMP 736" /LENGTH=89 /DNA_ID=CAMNT_0027179641 /DNA_START=34 /DNA_END=299 /DNA_ORIENTATION=+
MDQHLSFLASSIPLVGVGSALTFASPGSPRAERDQKTAASTSSPQTGAFSSAQKKPPRTRQRQRVDADAERPGWLHRRPDTMIARMSSP